MTTKLAEMIDRDHNGFEKPDGSRVMGGGFEIYVLRDGSFVYRMNHWTRSPGDPKEGAGPSDHSTGSGTVDSITGAMSECMRLALHAFVSVANGLRKDV